MRRRSVFDAHVAVAAHACGTGTGVAGRSVAERATAGTHVGRGAAHGAGANGAAAEAVAATSDAAVVVVVAQPHARAEDTLGGEWAVQLGAATQARTTGCILVARE